jgi:glutamate dehydrogenase
MSQRNSAVLVAAPRSLIRPSAGGVTVSYFEWVQNREGWYWSEEEVNTRLKQVLTSSFQAVCETASSYKTDFRMAGYILAVSRVAEANKTRGLYP